MLQGKQDGISHLAIPCAWSMQDLRVGRAPYKSGNQSLHNPHSFCINIFVCFASQLRAFSEANLLSALVRFINALPKKLD